MNGHRTGQLDRFEIPLRDDLPRVLDNPFGIAGTGPDLLDLTRLNFQDITFYCKGKLYLKLDLDREVLDFFADPLSKDSPSAGYAMFDCGFGKGKNAAKNNS